MNILLTPFIPLILFLLLFISLGIYASFLILCLVGILLIITGMLITTNNENFTINIKTTCYNNPCCNTDDEEDYNEICGDGIFYRRW